MINAPALALALGLGSFVQPVSEFDIPFFLNNPAVRAETLRRCHNDYALARTPECENAEAAGTRSMGRPLSSRSPEEMPLLFPQKKAPPVSPPEPTVAPKGKESGA
jgi:hypothetical protein